MASRVEIIALAECIQHEDITNVEPGSSRALFDADVVIIDPARFSELWGQLEQTVRGYGVVPHDREFGRGRGIPGLMDERRTQVIRFLEGGGLLIAFLRPPCHVYMPDRGDGTDPNPRSQKWLDAYSWVPFSGVAEDRFGLRVRPVHVKNYPVIGTGPFQSFLRNCKDMLMVEAIVKEPARFPAQDVVVLGENRANEAVALQFSVYQMGAGKLVFLPPPAPGADKKRFTDALLHAILSALETSEATPAPSWLEQYRQTIPGLSSLDEQAGVLEQELEGLASRKRLIDEQRGQKEKFLKLLYEKGRFQLEAVVGDAFGILGFEVEKIGDKDWVISSSEGDAIVEVEGKDSNAVNMDKFRQLLNYVHDEAKQAGEEKKGILVGNAFRLTEPNERGDYFTDAVMRNAKANRYCLLPTVALFRLVCCALENDEDHVKQGIRLKIPNTVGLFEG